MTDSLKILGWFVFAMVCAVLLIAVGMACWMFWVALMVRLHPGGPGWLVVPSPLIFMAVLAALAVGVRTLFGPPWPRD